ncbi:Insulinoma-associated protein 2 [Sesbania bispinosa]|nr:Insulinoma-associated protein 2 [Sesbania bispinosa]
MAKVPNKSTTTGVPPPSSKGKGKEHFQTKESVTSPMKGSVHRIIPEEYQVLKGPLAIDCHQHFDETMYDMDPLRHHYTKQMDLDNMFHNVIITYRTTVESRSIGLDESKHLGERTVGYYVGLLLGISCNMDRPRSQSIICRSHVVLPSR